MKDFQHEQLFTDLTPAEAAVIEGGSIYFNSITSIKSGAERFPAINPDDVYINLGGGRVWGPQSMINGQYKGILKGPYEEARVSLFDEDPGRDDFIGSFDPANFPNGRHTVRIGEGGLSTYDLNFTIS